MIMKTSIIYFCLAAGLLVFTSHAAVPRIRGVPGVDYPTYRSIPKTSFKCSDQKYVPGFYADMETDCQVFHFCYKTRSESFLCPAGTIFNQAILACDSWFNSNCSLASLYYVVNAGPGMRNAGKNIPMLLRLRDRAQGTTTPAPVAPSTSAPEPAVPEQKREEVAPIVERNAVPDVKVDHEPADESKPAQVEDIGSSDQALPESFNSDHDFEDEASNIGDEVAPDEFSEGDPEDNAEMLVYNTDRDEGEPMFQEPERKDAVSDPFQNFYGVNPKQMNSGERWEFQKRTATPSMNPPYPATPWEKAEQEFLSRFTPHAINVPKHRRKPAYVVVDQTPETAFEVITEVPVSTQGPFTEPISLNTLVELNTELPDDYSPEKDEDMYDKFEGDAQVDEDQPEEPYYEPGSEVDVEPVGYSEQEEYGVEGRDESEQFQTEYTTEYLEPSEEFMPEDFADQSDVDPEEEGDDIVVYDDSKSPRAPITPKEKFVVIPDEIDFPTTEPSDIPEVMSEDSEVHEDPSESQESEDIYIVNDNVEGQPGYRYKVMQEGGGPQAFYDSRAGPYGVPVTGYDYRAQPRNMIQGRMQSQEFDFGRYQRYPQSYFQYVDQYGRPLNPQYVDPTSDHMPEDPTQTVEPDDLYEHGVYGDTYGDENMQAEGQSEEEEGRYIYNPQTGYYHGPGGRIYSSDGVEIRPPIAPVSAEGLDSSEQAGQEFMEYAEYLDQPEDEFSRMPEESEAAGAKGPEGPTDSSSAGNGDGYVEAEAYDVTESGLLKAGEGQPKDFIVLDEEGEAGVAGDSEFADEEPGFDDAIADEEPAEEFIDEKVVSKDNQTESARAGEEAHGGREEKVEEASVPEVGADSNLDLEKSVQSPQEPVDELPRQSMDFLDTVPQSPEVQEPVEPFIPGDFVDPDRKAPVPDLEDPFSSVDPVSVPASEVPQPPQPFSSDGFASSFLNQPPHSPAVNLFSSGGLAGSSDFTVPVESQFMNMGYQNPMDFGPYGLGPNMRQQFGMLDASSQAPFSGSKGTRVRSKPGKSEPLGNPLSLQNTMKTMKRGKFGMFKKLMKKNN